LHAVLLYCRALRQRLAEAESRAAAAQAALEENTTVALVKAGILDPDAARDRSKHMDDWSSEQVAAWLEELGHRQHAASVRSNRVDGLLLLHLVGPDWGHLGVTSPLDLRRIEVRHTSLHAIDCAASSGVIACSDGCARQLQQ
jgi:SAM domain (Sterile alpha motif)